MDSPVTDGHQMNQKPSRPLIEKFWEKTEVDLSTGCVLWISRKVRGKGSFKAKVDDKHPVAKTGSVDADWWIYLEVVGFFDKHKFFILHTCGNKACVNPKHMELRERAGG